VDLLILMLGTNDTKPRFGLCPEDIAGGMEQLVLLAKELPVWRTGNPEILIISPSHIRGTRDPAMHTKSAALAPRYRALAERNGCSFLDAEEICVFNKIDGTHLTASAHRALAERLTDMIPELIKGEYLEVAKKSENLNNSC
jgi:lysophospholipase L1-like esterase